MSRGDAAPDPGDATPQLGVTLTFPSPSSRSPALTIQRSARSRTAYFRDPKIAAEIGYKRKQDAARPSSSVLTLVIQRLQSLSPLYRAVILDSSLYDYGPE